MKIRSLLRRNKPKTSSNAVEVQSSSDELLSANKIPSEVTYMMKEMSVEVFVAADSSTSSSVLDASYNNSQRKFSSVLLETPATKRSNHGELMKDNDVSYNSPDCTLSTVPSEDYLDDDDVPIKKESVNQSSHDDNSISSYSSFRDWNSEIDIEDEGSLVPPQLSNSYRMQHELQSSAPRHKWAGLMCGALCTAIDNDFEDEGRFLSLADSSSIFEDDFYDSSVCQDEDENENYCSSASLR